MWHLNQKYRLFVHALFLKCRSSSNYSMKVTVNWRGLFYKYALLTTLWKQFSGNNNHSREKSSFNIIFSISFKSCTDYFVPIFYPLIAYSFTFKLCPTESIAIYPNNQHTILIHRFWTCGRLFQQRFKEICASRWHSKYHVIWRLKILVESAKPASRLVQITLWCAYNALT